MAESNGVKSFRTLVSEHGKLLVTGSYLAVILAGLGLFGVQAPPWGGSLVIGVTILLAVYLAGMNEHKEKLRLLARLRPKLEISGVGSISSTGMRRVMIRNLTCATLTFRAELTEIKPPLPGFPLPVPLRPTHLASQISPDGNWTVDVFEDRGDPDKLLLHFEVKGDHHIRDFPRRQRHELLVSVYAQEGGAARRWFYLVPQPDGSVVFSPGGIVKTTTPAGPAAG